MYFPLCSNSITNFHIPGVGLHYVNIINTHIV